jgi:ABC-type transport system involved in multi-copper enzyme maturation permease subunit
MGLPILLEPVTAKELSQLSRRWPTYAGRTLYVTLVASVLFLFTQGLARSPSLSPSEYAHLGRSLFETTLALQLAFAALASAAAGCDLIAREVRSGTLGLLLLTPLSAKAIVRGKFAAVIAQAGVLVLGGVPAIAISSYLGGAGYGDVAWAALLTLAWAAAVGALALYFSALLRSGFAALAATVLVLSASLGVPALLGAADRDWLGIAACVHPVFAAFAREFLNPGLTWQVAIPCFLATLASAAAAGLLLWRAAGRVERRAVPEGGEWQRQRERRAVEIAKHREATGAPRVRVLTSYRAVWDENPLLWKEFVLRPALRIPSKWRWRAGFLLLGLILWTWVEARAGREVSAFAVWGTLFTVLALVSGITLFVRDRGARRTDLLLSAPVTSWDLVRARLMAGLVFPETIGAMALFALTIVCWWGSLFLSAALVSALFLGFAYVLGGLAGVAARTVRGAFLVGGGILAALLALLPWACAALDPSGSLGAGLLPAVHPLAALEGAERSRVSRSEMFGRLQDLLPLCLLLYGSAIPALVWLLVRRFDRAVRRGETP